MEVIDYEGKQNELLCYDAADRCASVYSKSSEVT